VPLLPPPYKFTCPPCLLPSVENGKCLFGCQWHKVRIRFIEDWSDDQNFEKEGTHTQTHADSEVVLNA